MLTPGRSPAEFIFTSEASKQLLRLVMVGMQPRAKPTPTNVVVSANDEEKILEKGMGVLPAQNKMTKNIPRTKDSTIAPCNDNGREA